MAMVFEVENRPAESELCYRRENVTRLQATGKAMYFSLRIGRFDTRCALRQPLLLPTTCAVRADGDMVSTQSTPLDHAGLQVEDSPRLLLYLVPLELNLGSACDGSP